MLQQVQVSFSQLESACVDSNMEINNPECDNKDSIGASSKELLQPDSCETNENSQTTVAGSLQLQTDNTKIEIEVNDITKSSTDAMVVKEEKPEPKQEEAAMEHSANADNEK